MSFGMVAASYLSITEPGMPIPVLSYNFDEAGTVPASPTHGTGTLDSGGNGTGTLERASSMSGHGNAYHKNDTSLTVASDNNPPAMSTWSEMTVMFWYSNEYSGASVPIFVLEDGPGSDFAGITLAGDGSGEYWGSSSGWGGFGAGVGPVNGSGWKHIAMTVNSAGLCSIYFDGISAASHVSSNTFVDSISLTIGGGYWSHDARGMLDDLRLYNVALTEEQIQIIMNSPV